MDTSRIRVICVDDCSRLTAAWGRLFAREPDLEVVASLNSADELTSIARDRKADVVLMDLTMDGRDPFDALEELSRLHPEVRVIVCSGHSDPGLVERAMDAGAWGYVGKTAEPDRIMDAIRRVARGEMVIPRNEP